MKLRVIFILAGLLFVLAGCSSDKESEDDQMMEEMEEVEARTLIPDLAFERALIDEGIDDVEDGSVLTSAVELVVNLVLEDKGITNLTGIEDFNALEGLWLAENGLTGLDVSNNPNLLFCFVRDNNLQNLDVSGLTQLEKIEANGNVLVSLDISDNVSLQQLSLHDNLLESIDISNVPGTIQLNTFSIENNPLDCIQVNEEQLNDPPVQWTKDPGDTYSLDCT
ncbi:MAG: hypothetical protein WBM43_03105 [Flavobacteriaceae bacterium]